MKFKLWDSSGSRFSLSHTPFSKGIAILFVPYPLFQRGSPRSGGGIFSFFSLTSSLPRFPFPPIATRIGEATRGAAMNNNDTISREDRLAVVILAVTQSLLLLILHKTITHDAWPSGDWRWLFGFYSLVIGTPLFLYLVSLEWRDRANAWAAAGAASLRSELVRC